MSIQLSNRHNIYPPIIIDLNSKYFIRLYLVKVKIIVYEKKKQKMKRKRKIVSKKLISIKIVNDVT